MSEKTDEGEQKAKLSKADKKLLKKANRKVLNLLKDFGNLVKISEEPTNHLFVGNGGMLCNKTREEMIQLFSKFGFISDLVMLPQKSFAFVSFKNIESTVKASTQLDGFVMKSQLTTPPAPLYLKYLHSNVKTLMSTPDTEYPSERQRAEIKDLVIIEDFIDEQNELELINLFQKQIDEINDSAQSLKHRKVLHFGYEFCYDTNDVDRSNPLAQKIPEMCKPILEKLLEQDLVPFLPDQLTVNHYEPGQGIPPHIDTHSAFEDGIISVSLNSHTVMDFSNGVQWTKPVILPRRSVLVMKGQSRYLFSHGIPPRKFDIVYTTDNASTNSNDDKEHLTLRERGTRISLTFRKVRHIPCTCNFPSKCNSRFGEWSKETRTYLPLPVTCSEASSLEGDYVYNVYEEIADHFSSTRHSPWPKVKEFLCNLRKGSLVADVGCGNGKYLGVNKDIIALGSDRSVNLAKICEERDFQVLVADCLQVPYRSNSFDACICIAVIHHLSTEARRLEALKELVRITRVGGLVLVYVWALEQKQCDKDENVLVHTATENHKENETEKCKINSPADDHVEKTVRHDSNISIEVSEGRYKFQQQDLLVPWHLKGGNKSKNIGPEKVYHRFYHVFKEGELKELCLQLDNVNIERLYLDCGNWCVVLKKLE